MIICTIREINGWSWYFYIMKNLKRNKGIIKIESSSVNDTIQVEIGYVEYLIYKSIQTHPEKTSPYKYKLIEIK